MIETKNLTFKFPNNALGLADFNVTLPSGSRTILVGPNGAGKSTLLRILSGKKLASQGSVIIDGVDPFSDTMVDTPYLGLDWASNPMVKRDVSVMVLLATMGGNQYPERRDWLVKALDIDLRWHMHEASDGQRRRVQLAMGLLRPWKSLFLDEVTVDLDVLTRYRFLEFLRQETEQRGAQIVYATHIFDGLHHWPTHIVRMLDGKCVEVAEFEDFKQRNSHPEEPFSLHQVVLDWIIDEDEKNNTKLPKWTDMEAEELQNGSVRSILEHIKT